MKISVVIPTYNRSKELPEAVRSVLAQKGDGEEFKVTEIWIIDDCSKEDIKGAVEAIADGRIRYHRLPENKGAGGARNEGVRLSGNEWIAFQDSDDLWSPEKLQKQVALLKRHPEMEMVCTGIRTSLSGNRVFELQMDESTDQFKQLAVRNFAGAPTMLVKKDGFLKRNGFDEELKALEDWDLALRYADRSVIGFVPEMLLEVRMHDDGVSSDAGNYFDARCRMIAKNREILTTHGCFQKALEQLLTFAEQSGVLAQIGNLMEIYLRQYG